MMLIDFHYAAEVVGCIIGRIGVTAVIDFWARVVPLAIPMLTSRVHAELLAHVIAATCHATDIDRIQHHPDRYVALPGSLSAVVLS